MSSEKSGVPIDSPPPAYDQSTGAPPVQAGYVYQYPPPQGGYNYVQGQGQPVYTGQPQYGQVVVTYPPGTYPVAGQQNIPPPPDYFTKAIFVTLCCFWPTGILAILRASDARSAVARGDMVSATASANSARTMINLSIGIGILSIVFLCVFMGIYFGVILKNIYDYDD